VTQKKDLPVYVPFIAGGIGGTFYWVFNYPFDYVKTLMQTDNLNNLKYKSTIQCFRDSYQSHGIKGFYKGYVICMMRSFPVNAAAIVVYRMMQRATGV
jgi:solute carrier family 25 (mitochondrial carnitine/acylcarnitine transporter), member 20/29